MSWGRGRNQAEEKESLWLGRKLGEYVVEKPKKCFKQRGVIVSNPAGEENKIRPEN